MAAVPITIVGTLTGKATKEGDVSATEQVVIQGIASLTGVEVGGGPMPGGPPLGFWGGRPPEYVDIMPPIPQPPPPYPDAPPDVVKPPPEGGGWGYDPAYGWFYVPSAGGPTPKRGKR
jgi:hypothetical protein